MRTPRRFRWLAAAAATGLMACGPLEPSETPEPDRLTQAVTALAAGDHERAGELFRLMEGDPALACEAAYGQALVGLLEAVARVDDLVDALVTFGLAGAPGLLPQQKYNQVVEGFLGPFEAIFERIRLEGLAAIEGGCTLTVPNGIPLEAGTPGKPLYLKVRIGEEWDEGAARLLVALMDFAMAGIDEILAHKLEISDNFEDAMQILTGAIDQYRQYGPADPVSRTTWITPARAAGVIFDYNPNLLALEDAARLNRVPQRLLEGTQLLYQRDANGEHGLIPALMARARVDADPRDNVLAWIDDGDGLPGSNDVIHIGLLEADIASTIRLPENTGGIEIQLLDAYGDFGRAVAAWHEILDNVGDQLAAVGNSTQVTRLGLRSFNEIVAAFPVLADNLPVLPEAVEFDLRTFFTDPVPLRDLLPYWYDPGTGVDVFLIEGEHPTTSPVEPFVYADDVTHFPSSFRFDTLGALDGRTVADVRIPPDGLFPDPDDRRLEEPVPYVAWQDPSFHGLLWIAPKLLPLAPEGTDDTFLLADQYLVNKALVAYTLYLWPVGGLP